MTRRKNRPSRRSFLQGAVPAVAGGLAAFKFAPQLLANEAGGAEKARTKSAATTENGHEAKTLWSNAYWAQKGDVKLYMFRKRMGAPQPQEPPLPVLFLVHGSSLSARSSFDLNAGAHGNYSIMDKFAGYGFDVWTMDFEGYGKSSPGSGNSNIADGVEDLKAAVEVVAKETGQQRFHFFGESSGACVPALLRWFSRSESIVWSWQPSPTRAKVRPLSQTVPSNSTSTARIIDVPATAT